MSHQRRKLELRMIDLRKKKKKKAKDVAAASTSTNAPIDGPAGAPPSATSTSKTSKQSKQSNKNDPTPTAAFVGQSMGCRLYDRRDGGGRKQKQLEPLMLL